MHFKYASMNAGKSIDLIRTAYNYEENGYKVLIVKSAVDTKADDKISSRIGAEKEVDVIMNTFSKSLASIGGCMAASKEVCDHVRHASRPFIFSASLTPASCACALQALRELKARPEMVNRLKELGNYCRASFSKRGLHIVEASTPIVPIYTYTPKRTFIIAQKLFDRGVYVNPVVSPAAPEGECLLRVTLMATHNEKLIDEAADIIADVISHEKTEE